MPDPFLIKLLLSFITGFIWLFVISKVAAKFGTKVGGVIAGIPSTLFVAFLFIAITQSTQAAAQSTTLVPLVVGINTIFVAAYVFLARKMHFVPSLLAAIAAWALAAFFVVESNMSNFALSVALFFPMTFLSYTLLEKKFNIDSSSKAVLNYTTSQLLFRSFVGGFLITLAVLMAKIGGPLIGGMFAAFPALTIALIIVSRLHHGEEYTEALLKNFIITGALSVLIYTIAVRYSYPEFGLFYGTIVSLIISIIGSYFGYHLINKKMK